MQVPQDAHTVDIVLSDSGDDAAGFFDNNDGLDYHIPVTGSSHPAHPLHVVHIAVEMAPVAKVLSLASCLCPCRSISPIAVGMATVCEKLWYCMLSCLLPRAVRNQVVKNCNTELLMINPFVSDLSCTCL